MRAAAFLKPKHSKHLGSPPWVIFWTLVIFAFSQILASFIVLVFLSLLHPGVRPADLLNNSVPGQFFFVLLAEAMAAGLVVWTVRRRRLGLGFIGLGRKPKLSDLWWALGGVVVFYIFLIVASLLVSVFLPGINTSQHQQLGFNNLSTASDGILAFCALVLLPPFGEEPLIRGYLFSGLRAHWRFWPAAIVTSILFGVAHLEFGAGAPLLWAAGIDTFILSMVLVYLRESSGALYAGILVHFLNNLVAFGVHFK